MLDSETYKITMPYFDGEITAVSEEGTDDIPVFWGMEVQVGEEVPLEEVCLAAQPEPGLVWKWNHAFSIPVILEEAFQEK